MIEAKVEMIGSSMETNNPIVILRGKNEEKGILPVGIGLMEAYAIYLGLENKSMPRPLTHDLLASILCKCEIEVLCIKVIDIRNQTFYGEIELKQGEEIKTIDSRPSDAIALALRKDVPIYIAEKVAEEAFVYGDASEYVNPLEFQEQF